MVAYTLTGTSITVVVDFTPKVIPSSHPNFKRIVELVANPQCTEAQIAPLLDIPATIARFTNNAVTVLNGKIYHNGFEVKTSLARKIMQFVNAGDEGLAAPLMAFLNNVLQNPDPRAGADLFDWVQASGLPLTGDGQVLAWKAVRSDYRSIHSPNDGRFDHHVGNIVSMPRAECDADPDRTCSRGLHFCSADYLSSYAGGGHRVVVVKIHPKDVVAFPRDYGLAKGRACSYQIVGEVPYDQVKTFYPQGSPVYTGFDKIQNSVISISVNGTLATTDPKTTFTQGSRWQNRRGEIVEIVGLNATGNLLRLRYPDGREVNEVYANTGQAFMDRRNSPHDLVKQVTLASTAPPKPVFKLQTGHRYQLRDGRIGTVERCGTEVTYLRMSDGTSTAVHQRNGQQYLDLTRNHPQDVVADLGSATPRLGRFAEGQVWRARNGQTVKITSINDPAGKPTFPIRGDNGANFTSTGAYYNDRTSPADLVTLVSDVA